MTWIAPDNAVLAALTGSVTGIGINPLPTFDWNMVTGMIDPIITPIEATMNFFGGMLFMGLVILPAIWFSNVSNQRSSIWNAAHTKTDLLLRIPAHRLQQTLRQPGQALQRDPAYDA